MLRTWDLSVEDTYLQRTTRVGDIDGFAQADISPDGQQVAYRWLDDQEQGWVRFVDTGTGEATPASRLPVDKGGASGHLGTWHPQGGQYAAYCIACAESGTVTVLDSATGQPLRESRETSSTATATCRHWRTSTRVEACSPATRRAGRSSSIPRACNPGASPSTSERSLLPPRSGTGARRWCTCLPATVAPSAGG